MELKLDGPFVIACVLWNNDQYLRNHEFQAQNVAQNAAPQPTAPVTGILRFPWSLRH
jgi:hypothetical protein